MQNFRTLVVTLSASFAVVTSAALGIQPALAGGVVKTIAALVTCASASPCAQWSNTSTGNAVQVTSAGGNGLVGTTSAAARSGVYGGSQSSAGGYGVHGANASPNGFAVYGLGGNGVGVWANAFGAQPSLRANAAGGHAADLVSASGTGAVIAEGGSSTNGLAPTLAGFRDSIGAIIAGRFYGTVVASGQGGFPFIAIGYDAQSKDTGSFSVDWLGNVNYTGTLRGQILTRSGLALSAYATKTTQSNVEDSGTAQLVGGAAVVRLDPAYAQSLDMQTPYRVFLTPDADSHGLYVAQKNATAFIVREMQGGHGTLSFDYRILGTAAGHAADRMALMTPAMRATRFGHAR